MNPKKFMKRNSQKKQAVTEHTKTYTCKWCGKNKSENKFFKCSIDRGVLICSDCIKKKYNEICSEREKVLAIIICCHYLDIAFYKYIYDSLEDCQGIGYYIRQLNLIQNDPDNFEKGLLHNNIVGYKEADKRVDNAKKSLDKIIEILTEVRNDI